MIAHAGMLIGVVGFCICAAFSVCQGQQGDVARRDEQAFRAVAFLVVGLVSAAIAAWW